MFYASGLPGGAGEADALRVGLGEMRDACIYIYIYMYRYTCIYIYIYM